MKTQIDVPHHEYPSDVRDLVEGKITGLSKYYDRIVSMRALLEREKEVHRVELVANVGHGQTLVVDAHGELLNKALDQALDRMTHVLTRHKDKQTDKYRRGGRPGH